LIIVCVFFMIWVHGPRYLQAMYPDHETLPVPARAVTGLRLFAMILAGLFQKDRGGAGPGRAGPI
jgi:hypothetical protein